MTVETVVPEIRVRWLRGQENINYKRPNTYLCVGMRGSGKSSLLETIASRYPKVIDLFGSKDNESLAWCKPNSPFHDVLFIIGRNIVVSSQWPTVCIENLEMKHFEPHQVILTTHAFYNTTNEYFTALQKITTLLWDKRTFWTDPWLVIIREAANWIYSRLQIVKDSNMAKADFIQTLREARHSGIAVGVDTIRWTNIDKEVRDISDYIFMKRVGSIGLPKDLHFVYRFISPPGLMHMKPAVFVLLSSQGNMAVGKFQYPEWHKAEQENILFKLDIDIQYCGQSKERLSNVSMMEHVQIIETYCEQKSMHKTAAVLRRSTSTIQAQSALHNKTIAEVGYCIECRQGQGKHDTETLKRRKEPFDDTSVP